MIELRQLTDEEKRLLICENLDDMQRQQAALLGLQKVEGWKVFEVMVRMAERQAYDRLMMAKDAHQMAEAKGAYKALQDIRSWPARQSAGLGQSISQMLAEADPTPK